MQRTSVLVGLAVAGAAAMLTWPATAAAQRTRELKPLTRQAVDERIKALVDALWASRNKDGHWDQMNPKLNGQPPYRAHIGGKTGLALMALKAADGENEKLPDFQKALKWLVEQNSASTYCRGIRATLYVHLRDERVRPFLLADGEFLLSSFRGGSLMYSYFPPSPGTQARAGQGDYSNTNYGLLGMWSASDGGLEVPMKYWQLVEQSYLKARHPDGGFGYGRNADGMSTGSMTTAALASLYVIWEKLYVLNDGSCSGKPNPELLKAIDGGIDWLGKHFSPDVNPRGDGKRVAGGYVMYYVYNIERVGVASGLKYFGEHDWYREITTLRIQLGPPHQGGVYEAWELLFLAYGRAPVIFHKLDYGPGWNEHPRDLAMLCRALAKVYERHLNWQIMPISARQHDFHDAPILAMSGRKSFSLTDDQVAKVRTYLLRGGMLFAEAIGGSTAFTASFGRFCTQLFPNFELVRLPPTHPIYAAPPALDPNKLELWGLGDGVRTLIVFSPTDVSCDWQRMNLKRGETSFTFGQKLLTYATDELKLWSKEENYWPIDGGRKPDQRIAVGRLAYPELDAASVWDPTGEAGWQRLDILSRNGGGPAIVTVPTDLSLPLDPKAIPVLHATGAGPIKLTDAAKANLKAYVAGGGLLLADAAGGSKAFADSFAALCGELFGAGKLVPAPASALGPLGQLGPDGSAKVWYRHVGRLPRALRPLELLGVNVAEAGQPPAWNVLLVPCDLTYAMTGAPAADPVGIDSSDAAAVAMAILKWRTGRAP